MPSVGSLFFVLSCPAPFGVRCVLTRGLPSSARVAGPLWPFVSTLFVERWCPGDYDAVECVVRVGGGVFLSQSGGPDR